MNGLLKNKKSIMLISVVAVAAIAVIALLLILVNNNPGSELEGTTMNPSSTSNQTNGTDETNGPNGPAATFAPTGTIQVITPAPTPTAAPSGKTPLYITEGDYTNLWFRDRCLNQRNDMIVNVRTGKYGLSFNLSKATLRKMGTMKLISSDDALVESNSEIEKLQNSAVSLTIKQNNKTYSMTDIYNEEYNSTDILFNSRMIRSGVYMQSFDINSIRFGDFNGDARLEINAVPDYFTMSYDLYSKEDLSGLDLTMKFSVPSALKLVDSIKINGAVRAINVSDSKGTSYTILATDGAAGIPSISYDNNGTVTLVNSNVSVKKCSTQKTRRDGIGLLVIPGSTKVSDAMQFIYPLTDDDIDATGIAPYQKGCNLTYIPRRAVYEITLRSGRFGSTADEFAYILEQVGMKVNNKNEYAIKPMLMFTHTPCGNSFGTVSMIREVDGTPSGVPVQLTKNWHSTAGMPLYMDSNWYESYVPINVYAKSSSEFEYTNAFEGWGNVYAASHTQLCLIGYGGPQWLWEQTAIGGYGENFCYSPDLTIVSFMADMRPLNVISTSGSKLGWTNSVAGADFLVYFNENGKQQFLKQVKTYYKDYGPNLTYVKYAGVTMDDKIAAEYSVRMARSDDITRVYMTFDYEVLADTKFTRLAFLEIGADTNNESGFDTISIGKTSGAYTSAPDKTIPVKMMNTTTPMYLQYDIPLAKDAWLSLSGGPGEGRNLPGASADRGIVIRSWKASFSGKDYAPYMAIMAKNAHHGGFPSNQVDITVPDTVRKSGMLKKGDRVSCTFEYLILPQKFSDYTGPNYQLANILKTSESAPWKLVDFEAKGNNIIPTVSVGTLVSTSPTVIKAKNDSAEFKLKNGVGYVPVEFTGLSSNKGYVLEELVNGKWVSIAASQEKYGSDYWQCLFDPYTKTYTLTYNVFRDSTTSAGSAEASYRLRKAS